jgi:uncharacterized protein YjbI with pentapeptide repeats
MSNVYKMNKVETKEYLEHFLERKVDYLNDGLDLRGANLCRAWLKRADLNRANLQGADLTEANLMGCRLDRANIVGAYLSKANLEWSNLRFSNLSWANLGGANLTGCNTASTNLTRCNLKNAELEGTGILTLQESGCFAYAHESLAYKGKHQIYVRIESEGHPLEKWLDYSFVQEFVDRVGYTKQELDNIYNWLTEINGRKQILNEYYLLSLKGIKKELKFNFLDTKRLSITLDWLKGILNEK